MAVVDYLFNNARLPEGRVVSLAANGGRFSSLTESGPSFLAPCTKQAWVANWWPSPSTAYFRVPARRII